jgi:putative ABC transport system permease protein
VTTLYVAEASGVPALSWIDVAGAFAIGVALALAAAAFPAREASGLTPLDAIRSAARDAIDPASSVRRRMVSALCFAGTILATRQAPVEGLPVFGFVAALLVVFGAVCLVPDALTC